MVWGWRPGRGVQIPHPVISGQELARRCFVGLAAWVVQVLRSCDWHYVLGSTRDAKYRIRSICIVGVRCVPFRAVASMSRFCLGVSKILTPDPGKELWLSDRSRVWGRHLKVHFFAPGTDQLSSAITASLPFLTRQRGSGFPIWCYHTSRASPDGLVCSGPTGRMTIMIGG